MSFWTWLLESGKNLIKSPISQNKQSSLNKDGISVLITDDQEKSNNLIKALLQSYSDDEETNGLSFTNSNVYDEVLLDTWILKRTNDPHGCTFIVFNLLDVDFLYSNSFQYLLEKQEMINCAIYIAMPLKKLDKNFIKVYANKLFIQLTPRKLSTQERNSIYELMKLSISQQFHELLMAHKQKKIILYENNQIKLVTI